MAKSKKGTEPVRRTANKEPAQAGGPDGEMKVSKYQMFTPQRVRRSMMAEAPYNPRVIDDHSRKLLKKSVKDGLADAIVWNKRTGYIVGGHQRLGVLDELEGNQDYALDVLVIDVDEKKEREINIRLNNMNMTGAYSTDKLADLFINDGVSFAEAGFSALDVELMFDTPVADQILGIQREEEPEVVEDINKINEIKEARARGKDGANKKNTAEFFKVIVFNSMESMDEFLEHCQLDGSTRYIDGEIVKSLLGVSKD